MRKEEILKMKSGIKDESMDNNIKKILAKSGASITPIDKQVLASFQSDSKSKLRLDRFGNPIIRVDRAEGYAKKKDKANAKKIETEEKSEKE